LPKSEEIFEFGDFPLREFLLLLEKMIEVKATRVVNIVCILVFNDWICARWDACWAESYEGFHQSMYINTELVKGHRRTIRYLAAPHQVASTAQR
jgi:hypothetical protein